MLSFVGCTMGNLEKMFQIRLEYNKGIIFGLFQLKMLNQIEHEIALITYDTEMQRIS